MRNEKILKPLCISIYYSAKQFFNKQMNNKNGYAEYKFIATDTKSITEEQYKIQVKNKNDLLIRINQNKNNQ